MKIFENTQEDQEFFFGLKPNYKDRISNFLKTQLQDMLDTDNTADLYSIIEQINYLEGFEEKNRTKPPSEFQNKPLKGFWHKHLEGYTEEKLETNFYNYIKQKDSMNLLSENNKLYVIDSKQSLDKVIHHLVKQFYDYKNEKQLWTGDWLIYGKYNGENYYLMFSTHGKGRKDDNSIFNTMEAKCKNQFPFLFT